MGIFGGIRRGLNGLFGGGDIERLLAARAMADGDYDGAFQMMSQQRRQQAAQEQARAEAEAAEQQFQAQHRALAARGLDKWQIAAMTPDHRSATMADHLQMRRFGPEGGSVLNPATGGFNQAPWQRQVGRSIIQGGPNGAAPQTIYEGVEPISVPDGGSVHGITGSGRVVGQGFNPFNPQSAPQAPGQLVETDNHAALRQQAEDAIRRGADPAEVNRRLQQMIGGAGQPGPQTFPGQW